MQLQLVDEKVQSLNLMADAKAANRRAEKLPKLEIENEEYRSRVRQLERDVAEKIDSTQEGVGQLREALEMVKGELEVKEAENKALVAQIQVYEGQFLQEIITND